jgi:CheY-like chemotaxis protein
MLACCLHGAGVDRAIPIRPQAMSTETNQQVLRSHPRLPGVRILLVEDDPDTREVVAALLHESGATVRAVSSAAAAIQTFEQFGCDVVVTDYALPGTATGYQLLRQIRSQPVDANVPVVGYSAHAGMVPRHEQASFTRYVPKPEVLIELVGIVSQALEGRSGE